MGVIISADASAKGQFQATLLGTLASIEINGRVSAGSVGPGGTATFSGTCGLDVGDGNLRLQNVPFTVAVTTNAEGQGRLGLLIGTTSLPGAIVNEGEHDDPVVLSLPPDLVTPAYLGRRCAGP